MKNYLIIIIFPIFSFAQIDKAIKLNEVIVSKSKINAVDLGIISNKSFKINYTPAERRLQYANSGVISPLINSITGKTSMFKKEIVVESKQRALEKISNNFDNEYFIKNLKIDSTYIKAFQYYLIENNDFIKILNSKNKFLTEFLLVQLAYDFNNLKKKDKN
jgi:hypothetical protein